VGATATGTITSGGRARTYLVHLPAGYRADRPTPVVLAFHGRKGTGNDIEAFSGIDSLDAIAVYPRGLPATTDNETAWEGAPGAAPVDDVRFVSDLIDRLDGTLCVDQGRVFATGKSEGGGFTALLACTLPDRIAAFATVSGAFYPATGCTGGRPVPLVDLHGTGDTIMRYDGGVSHREHYPSIPDWLAGWVTRDRCGSSTSAPIGSDVTHLTWTGCAPGSALEHYRIAGGGHTWPGAAADSGPGKVTHTISATQVAWAFFQAHARN
jgi:polyhydroxybutyrate depolymerase